MPRLVVGQEGRTPVELHYQDYGSGEPIVLIHGWPLSGRAWESQVPALVQAGYRVITYDRRGFGQSSQPWGGYEYETFTADLKALLDGLDVKGATLVGFSMGGGEVARYFGKYGKGRASRAVFAGAVTPFLLKSKDNPEGGLDDATIAQLENGVKGDRLAFLDAFTKNFFSANGKLMVSEPLRLFARTIGSFASPKGTLDCIAAFGRTDFRADLKRIDVPTLVIHGDADAIVPLEVSGKRTQQAIGGSRLVVVKDGPHGFTSSHADEFNRALIQFLRG
jgi:pimeloyl-ACP methyl ester carboxylesterase